MQDNEWFEKLETVHTFLQQSALDHTQNKLKLFTMFPNFFIFPSTFN